MCTVMCMRCYRVYCEKRLVKLSLYLQNIFELGRKKGTKGLMTRKIRNLVHIENDESNQIWAHMEFFFSDPIPTILYLISI